MIVDLQAKGITHVLSVDEKPLPDILTSQVNYRHVFALDLYDFDLLSFFPECLTFIDQGRESGGRVLVHWCVRDFVSKLLSFISLKYRSFFITLAISDFFFLNESNCCLDLAEGQSSRGW